MSQAHASDGQIRVLVVEDFAQWRQYLCSLLEAQPGLRVIGEASDGHEAVQQAQSLKPDLILLDIGLPNLNGIQAAKQIRQAAPETKIMFVTEHSDKGLVEEALSIGAQAYILKIDVQRDLLRAIAGVMGGDDFVSSGIKRDGH